MSSQKLNIFKPNYLSAIIDIFCLLALLSFCTFLILLGEISTIASSIAIMAFIYYKWNFVISVSDNDFTVFHYFKKVIPLRNVTALHVKEYGFGATKSLGITMSYEDENGNIKNPILIHYYWTGSVQIVRLLNFLKNKVNIDIESFKKINIIFENDKFSKQINPTRT